MDPSRRLPGPRHTRSWLPLILLCGCIWVQSSDAAASLRPKILAPLQLVKSPLPGRNWTISCQAQSPFPAMNLIYWLVNGSFVEDLYPGEAVREGPVRAAPNGTGVLLTRDLLFQAFSLRDRCSSFTCVVRNPAGLAKTALRWEPAGPCAGWTHQQERREDGWIPRSTGSQAPGCSLNPRTRELQGGPRY